jgi:signal transduction histidine kinase
VQFACEGDTRVNLLKTDFDQLCMSAETCQNKVVTCRREPAVCSGSQVNIGLPYITMQNSKVTALPAADDRLRQIVILHGMNYSNPVPAIVSASLRKRLIEMSSGKLIISADFFDLQRKTDAERELRLAQLLQEKYSNVSFDLIVAIDPAGLALALKHRDIVSANTPIAFVGVSPQTYAQLQPAPNVTGIFYEFDLEKTLTLARHLQPNARELFIVTGNAPIDQSWQVAARRAVEAKHWPYAATYLFDLEYQALLDAVRKIPRGSIVVLLSLLSIGSSKNPPWETAAVLGAISPAPVYSPYAMGMDYSEHVVGGFSETAESMGIAAADLALEILAGKAVSTLPPRSSPGRAYRVNPRALQRWGLSEANLPKGTILHSKQLNAPDGRDDVQLHPQETIEKLSGAIVHEVKQPLTAILSNAQAALNLLSADSPDIAEARDALNDIVQADKRAVEVIDRLRTLLTKGERKSEPIDINQLVNSTIRLLNTDLSRRETDVRLELAPDLPMVSGDPIQLQQVLINLANNALDAMTSTPRARRVLTISNGVSRAGTIEILVRDNGTGIEAPRAGQLFEPFYTSKEHGLGLGLTICSTIVLSHGGALDLTNNKEGGATARLSLPSLESALSNFERQM